MSILARSGTRVDFAISSRSVVGSDAHFRQFASLRYLTPLSDIADSAAAGPARCKNFRRESCVVAPRYLKRPSWAPDHIQIRDCILKDNERRSAWKFRRRYLFAPRGDRVKPAISIGAKRPSQCTQLMSAFRGAADVIDFKVRAFDWDPRSALRPAAHPPHQQAGQFTHPTNAAAASESSCHSGSIDRGHFLLGTLQPDPAKSSAYRAGLFFCLK